MTNHSDKSNEAASETGRSGYLRYIFYGAFVLLLLMAVFSYSPTDGDILAGGARRPPENWIGTLGAGFAGLMFHLFGLATYLLSALLSVRLVRICFPSPGRTRFFFWGTILSMTGATLLLALSPEAFAPLCDRLGLGSAELPELAISGGVIGQFFAAPPWNGDPPLEEGVLRMLLGAAGVMTVGWAAFTAGILMMLLSDYGDLLKTFLTGAHAETPGRGDGAAFAPRPSPGYGKVFEDAKNALKKLSSPGTPSPAAETAEKPEIAPAPKTAAFQTRQTTPEVREFEVPAMTGNVTESGRGAAAPSGGDYVLPKADMLDKGSESEGESPEAIAHAKTVIQNELDSFNISGVVSNHVSGPRITRYEIQLSPGVKTQKVVEIESNIAMSMEAKSIRVLAPIPGRNAVGIEAPNRNPEMVLMRSVLESEAWTKSGAEIPIVLGKDVCGRPMILDLAKAPHLLIAGSTGSGKSVCMNTLIMSLLFKFRPDELKLIMVDPKIVEFEDYKTLPHLITPVVNDSRKVPVALRWAVNEMEKRYRQLALAHVKKLSEYNRRPLDEEIFDEDDMPLPPRLPILVVIVDELADLMMTDARKDAEQSIARIAQKGRAAGIHIVLATQRPSRDIITGVIKANLPTKIAFMVGSQVDSRVILDQVGAERLLGKGDMLFLPPQSATLERIQGAMVSDKNIRRVVDFVSAQAKQDFNDEVVAEDSGDGEEEDGVFSRRGRAGDADFDDGETSALPDVSRLARKYMKVDDDNNMRLALELIIGEGKISTSYLQRRLGIGYNRAAEIIDKLEKRGIVSAPLPGGGKREILITDALEVNGNE